MQSWRKTKQIHARLRYARAEADDITSRPFVILDEYFLFAWRGVSSRWRRSAVFFASTFSRSIHHRCFHPVRACFRPSLYSAVESCNREFRHECKTAAETALRIVSGPLALCFVPVIVPFRFLNFFLCIFTNFLSARLNSKFFFFLIFFLCHASRLFRFHSCSHSTDIFVFYFQLCLIFIISYHSFLVVFLILFSLSFFSLSFSLIFSFLYSFLYLSFVLSVIVPMVHLKFLYNLNAKS